MIIEELKKIFWNKEIIVKIYLNDYINNILYIFFLGGQ